MRLVIVLLWDIDGTLLTTGRAGVFALEEAAAEALGRPADLQEMHTSGLTDAQIAVRILVEHHVEPTPERVGTFLERYATALPQALPRRQGRVLAGVRAILEDLADEPGVLNLLLTGNVEAGARAKLSHYGLDGWLEAGAFCDGPGERADIARRAVEVATRRLGDAPSPDRTYVIGDTPHDVGCGQAIGARTIAVASGVHDIAQLRACDPWHVLEELPTPEAFRQLVGVGL